MVQQKSQLFGLLGPKEMQTLLSYGGYGALVEAPDWIFWLQLVIALIGYVGMVLFRNLFRVIFLLRCLLKS